MSDEFDLLTRASMLQFSETSQIFEIYEKIRNRIDKQLTYFIIMKFNPDISLSKLSDFLITQGPIPSSKESENLMKAYSRMKKI